MREVNGFFLFEIGQMVLLRSLAANVDLRPVLRIVTDITKYLRDFVDDKGNQENLPDAVGVANIIAKKLEEVAVRDPYPHLTPNDSLEIN